MTNRFESKTLIVTGASSGIGRATALRLGAEGARLVLSGRKQPALEAVAAEARASGGEAVAQPGDLRDEAHVTELAAVASATFGGLDGVVNCAGVCIPGPVHEGTGAAWREMLETNVLGLALCCREALRVMGSKGGTIVNVSALAGTEPASNFALYTASKHAVNGFTESLRLELENSPVHHVVLVEPGQTATSISRHVPHAVLQETAQALGFPPDAVPNYEGGHAPPEFLSALASGLPDRFLAPEAVAGAIVEALLDPASRGRITLRPGTPA